MKLRVAAASSDGKVINQHFGAARQFLVFDLDGNEISYVETRINEPPCAYGEHSDYKLLKSIQLISDCKLVLISKIGPTAKSYLNLEGIDVIETATFIEDAVSKLQKSKYFLNTVENE